MIISKRNETYLYLNHHAKENNETKWKMNQISSKHVLLAHSLDKDGNKRCGGIGKSTERYVRWQAGTGVPTSSHHDLRRQYLATTSSPERQALRPLTWAGDFCFDWRGSVQIGQHLPVVSFHCFWMHCTYFHFLIPKASAYCSFVFYLLSLSLAFPRGPSFQFQIFTMSHGLNHECPSFSPWVPCRKRMVLGVCRLGWEAESSGNPEDEERDCLNCAAQVGSGALLPFGATRAWSAIERSWLCVQQTFQLNQQNAVT